MPLYPIDKLPRQYAPDKVQAAFKQDDVLFLAGFRSWCRGRGIYVCDPVTFKREPWAVTTLASQAGCTSLLPLALS